MKLKEKTLQHAELVEKGLFGLGVTGLIGCIFAVGVMPVFLPAVAASIALVAGAVWIDEKLSKWKSATIRVNAADQQVEGPLWVLESLQQTQAKISEIALAESFNGRERLSAAAQKRIASLTHAANDIASQVVVKDSGALGAEGKRYQFITPAKIGIGTLVK